MSIVFEQAAKKDIPELVRMRIAYMTDDLGPLPEADIVEMQTRLPDYFSRKLGDELIAFTAKDGERTVSTAFLHIIEAPSSPLRPHGLYGEVLNVYTEPAYRGKGLCTHLMQDLIACAKARGLDRIELSATADGLALYKKAGFVEKATPYTEMRYDLNGGA